jgi:hypothetical protein
MSVVISFRLDRTNPREARALDLLNAYIEQGYNARFILTQALLELDHPGSDLEMSQDDQGLQLVLDHIDQLIEIVRVGESNPLSKKTIEPELPKLNDRFLASIKQGAKPGIKLG